MKKLKFTNGIETLNIELCKRTELQPVVLFKF